MKHLTQCLKTLNNNKMLLRNLPSLIPHPSLNKMVTRMSSNSQFTLYQIQPPNLQRWPSPLSEGSFLWVCYNLSLPCKHFSCGSWQRETLEGHCKDSSRKALLQGLHPLSSVTHLRASGLVMEGPVALISTDLSGPTTVTHSGYTQPPHPVATPMELWPCPVVADYVFLWQSHPL